MMTLDLDFPAEFALVLGTFFGACPVTGDRCELIPLPGGGVTDLVMVDPATHALRVVTVTGFPADHCRGGGATSQDHALRVPEAAAIEAALVRGVNVEGRVEGRLDFAALHLGERWANAGRTLGERWANAGRTLN